MQVADPTTIIKILLDLDIDLDNLSSEEDYLSALLEGQSAIEFSTKGKGDPRSEILRSEILRVRNERKPRVRRTKITASSFKPRVTPRLTASKISAPSLQPTQVVEGESSSLSVGFLQQIRASLNSIINTLSLQNLFDKKDKEKQRIEGEEADAQAQEDNLESKRFEGVRAVTSKVLAPVQNVFSRIFQFLQAIFFGRIVFKLLEWFGDPKNARKIQALGNFLKNFWPAIVGSALLFGTSLGRMVTMLTIKAVASIPKLLIFAKALGAFIAANPLAAAAAVGIGALSAYGIKRLSQENVNEQTQGFAGGGKVRGTDTIPAMLTPGEFVMSRGAVQKYGADTLAAMNAAGGGTNKPKILENRVYAQTGGLLVDGMELPGLGGGGGGTNAITDKGKGKSFGTRTKDIGNLLSFPFRDRTEVDPTSKFPSGLGGGGGGTDAITAKAPDKTIDKRLIDFSKLITSNVEGSELQQRSKNPLEYADPNDGMRPEDIVSRAIFNLLSVQDQDVQKFNKGGKVGQVTKGYDGYSDEEKMESKRIEEKFNDPTNTKKLIKEATKSSLAIYEYFDSSGKSIGRATEGSLPSRIELMRLRLKERRESRMRDSGKTTSNSIPKKQISLSSLPLSDFVEKQKMMELDEKIKAPKRNYAETLEKDVEEAKRANKLRFFREQNERENALRPGSRPTGGVLTGDQIADLYGPANDAGDAMDGGGFLPEMDIQIPPFDVGTFRSEEKMLTLGIVPKLL